MTFRPSPSKPNPKLPKSTQARTKWGKRQSKKKALICLDFLVRFEPFQWCMLTPWGIFSFSAFAAIDRRSGDVKSARALRHARRYGRSRPAEICHAEAILAGILIFSKKTAKNLAAGDGLPNPKRTQAHAGFLRPNSVADPVRRCNREPLHATVGARQRRLLTIPPASSGSIYSAASRIFPYARSSRKSVRREDLCGKPISGDS